MCLLGAPWIILSSSLLGSVLIMIHGCDPRWSAERMALNQMTALTGIIGRRSVETVQMKGAEFGRVPDFCW